MGYYDFKTNQSNAQPALYLGTYSSGETINVASKYAKYASLTVDNFVIEPIGSDVQGNATTSGYIQDGGWTIRLYAGYMGSCSFSKSYNASTGNLSITAKVNGGTSSYMYDRSGGSVYWPANGSKSKDLSVKVYLLPAIENV